MAKPEIAEVFTVDNEAALSRAIIESINGSSPDGDAIFWKDPNHRVLLWANTDPHPATQLIMVGMNPSHASKFRGRNHAEGDDTAGWVRRAFLLGEESDDDILMRDDLSAPRRFQRTVMANLLPLYGPNPKEVRPTQTELDELGSLALNTITMAVESFTGQTVIMPAWGKGRDISWHRKLVPAMTEHIKSLAGAAANVTAMSVQTIALRTPAHPYTLKTHLGDQLVLDSWPQS